MGGQYQQFYDYCYDRSVNPNEATVSLICSCFESDLRAGVKNGGVAKGDIHASQKHALIGAAVLVPVKNGTRDHREEVDEARLNYFLDVAERLRR